MPRDRYEPLKLNQTNRYAGYQFHARVRVDGMEASDAFQFLILSVYHWIRSRVPEDDRGVPELALPEAEDITTGLCSGRENVTQPREWPSRGLRSRTGPGLLRALPRTVRHPPRTLPE